MSFSSYSISLSCHFLLLLEILCFPQLPQAVVLELFSTGCCFESQNTTWRALVFHRSVAQSHCIQTEACKSRELSRWVRTGALRWGLPPAPASAGHQDSLVLRLIFPSSLPFVLFSFLFLLLLLPSTSLLLTQTLMNSVFDGFVRAIEEHCIPGPLLSFLFWDKGSLKYKSCPWTHSLLQANLELLSLQPYVPKQLYHRPR